MVTDYRVVADVGAPAVVVVHDRDGLLPSVRGLCDALAAAGLTALAVDLHDAGSPADDAPARGRIAGVVRDLRRSGVMAPRISGLGLGAGGALVLDLAAAGLFDSVVAYAVAGAHADADLPCPVLLQELGEAQDPRAASRSWEATVAFLGGR